MGDPNAALDAAGCGQIVAQCQQDLANRYTGASIRVMKQADGTWTLNGSTCTAPAQPVVTVADVRDRVVRLIPTAALGLAPHDTSLINIETLMWIEAPTTQQLPPVTILGQHVHLTLHLDHVTWDFGDQHTDTTTNPGRPYDADTDPCHAAQCPDYYGHTYRATAHLSIHATAAWHARFSVDGGQMTDIPGTVTGPTATTGLTIKQARTVLVPNPGEH